MGVTLVGLRTVIVRTVLLLRPLLYGSCYRTVGAKHNRAAVAAPFYSHDFRLNPALHVVGWSSLELLFHSATPSPRGSTRHQVVTLC
jgi:hypothetical protein